MLPDGSMLTSDVSAQRITWFAPERPVEGGTVFVRPEVEPAVVTDVPEAE